MIQTAFSQMKPEELYLQFEKEHWQGLDAETRLQALQEIENRQAVEMGREPCDVVALPFEDENGNSDGVYGMYDGNNIAVNAHLLEENGFIDHGDVIVREDANVQLLDTVLHEGRHAFQDFAIANPGAYDALETARFTVNNAAGNYVNDSTVLYDIQPVERDAWDYAEGKTEEIFEILQDKYGVVDEGYEEYAVQSSIRKEIAAEELADNLDANPEFLQEYEESMINNYEEQTGERMEIDMFDNNKDNLDMFGHEEAAQAESLFDSTPEPSEIQIDEADFSEPDHQYDVDETIDDPLDMLDNASAAGIESSFWSKKA